jgi:hypothetical protein
LVTNAVTNVCVVPEFAFAGLIDMAISYKSIGAVIEGIRTLTHYTRRL